MMPSINSNDAAFRNTISKAIELNRQGKYRSAIKILLPMLETHPRSAVVSGYLGSSYFELGEYERSADYFQRAIQLSPKSELSSLGLFHSLWHQDAFSNAFAEMKRFLSISDSKEYSRLLRDLAVEGRLGPNLIETVTAK